MDISILSMLLQNSSYTKSESLSTPRIPNKTIPVGTKISYPWYGKTIYGEVIPTGTEWARFGFQCARLGLEESKVIIIINPNKATVL